MSEKKERPVSPETLVRFGVALRKAREAAGMTLDEVAALCPKTTVGGKSAVMNKGNISRIERGLQPNVTFTVLQRLAEAVGMDVDIQLSAPPPPSKRKAKKP